MTDSERQALIQEQMRHQTRMAFTGAANALEASGFDGLAFAADLAGALRHDGLPDLAEQIDDILDRVRP